LLDQINPKKMARNWVKSTIYLDNIILMKPTVDASNKQIFVYNDTKASGNAVLEMIEGGSGQQMAEKIFRPSKFGDFSNQIGP